MTKLILASKSARRQEILQNLGVKFSILSREVDESVPSEITDPAETVCGLAARKYYAVAGEAEPDSIIIAADTIVALESGGKTEIFGKPRDLADAAYMLSSMSGKTHSVYTGLAVGSGDGTKLTVESVCTNVTFRSLTQAEIDYYINAESVLDKAGAYGIQEYAGLFVSRIEGEYFNIVGLPVSRLSVILRDEFGVELYNFTEKK